MLTAVKELKDRALLVRMNQGAEKFNEAEGELFTMLLEIDRLCIKMKREITAMKEYISEYQGRVKALEMRELEVSKMNL